jgi:hypothetical protein
MSLIRKSDWNIWVCFCSSRGPQSHAALLAGSAKGPLAVGRSRICKAASERSEAGERVSR